MKKTDNETAILKELGRYGNVLDMSFKLPDNISTAMIAKRLNVANRHVKKVCGKIERGEIEPTQVSVTSTEELTAYKVRRIAKVLGNAPYRGKLAQTQLVRKLADEYNSSEREVNYVHRIVTWSKDFDLPDVLEAMNKGSLSPRSGYEMFTKLARVLKIGDGRQRKRSDFGAFFAKPNWREEVTKCRAAVFTDIYKSDIVIEQNVNYVDTLAERLKEIENSHKSGAGTCYIRTNLTCKLCGYSWQVDGDYMPKYCVECGKPFVNKNLEE